MGYYQLLKLKKEPFSSSPDPQLFYLSRTHKAALYRLCVAARLRRGLSLVLGDVGTGKTTLSRRFAQMVSQDPQVELHPILNPVYRGATEFLTALCDLWRLDLGAAGIRKESDYYTAIENYLFRRVIEEGRTVVLLVDEAQKMEEPCLEVLRGLLNYETNDHKLIQVVLFSQLEILPRIRRMRNFWDRISVKTLLSPLDFEEAIGLIRFRLKECGHEGPEELFSEEAVRVIFRYAGGFPRRITQICHDCLEHLVMHGFSCVDHSIAEELVRREGDFASAAVESAPPKVPNAYDAGFAEPSFARGTAL